jgi:hypothetical protein
VPGWADVVFHVLAHVPGRLPSSLHSHAYQRFVADLVGPASERALGEDARVLGELLTDHASLAAVQALAWLWREPEHARAEQELDALANSQVDDARLLAALRGSPAAELLRCAALLELEVYAQLPAPPSNQALRDAVAALVPQPLPVVTSRPLTEHGRVWNGVVYVGVPGEGVTLEHAAHQAAHEHTVHELRDAGLEERGIEAVALVRLHRRLEGTPHAAAHRRWCARCGVRDEHLDPTRLTPAQRAVLAR